MVLDASRLRGCDFGLDLPIRPSAVITTIGTGESAWRDQSRCTRNAEYPRRNCEDSSKESEGRDQQRREQHSRRCKIHNTEFEHELLRELKWKHLSEIPDCPVVSFCDLLNEVRTGIFFVSVDYIAANMLALSTSSPFFSSLSVLISWVPYLVALACLPAAYLVGDVWVLAGVVLSLIAMFISSPVNPARRFATIVGILSAVGALWFGLHSAMTPAILCLSYAVSFSAIRILYFLNSRRLTRAALDSEPILLWLLENRHSYILNTSTDEVFWGGREE